MGLSLLLLPQPLQNAEDAATLPVAARLFSHGLIRTHVTRDDYLCFLHRLLASEHPQGLRKLLSGQGALGGNPPTSLQVVHHLPVNLNLHTSLAYLSPVATTLRPLGCRGVLCLGLVLVHSWSSVDPRFVSHGINPLYSGLGISQRRAHHPRKAGTRGPGDGRGGDPGGRPGRRR